MLHWLLAPVSPEGFGINVVRYISFRAACALLTAFAMCLYFGPWAIARLRAGQVREDTDKTGSQRLAEISKPKRGTPTMGGLFLCGAILVAFFSWTRLDNVYAVVGIGLLLGFALIGMADDWIKLREPGRKGLSARAKLVATLLVAGAVAVALCWSAWRTEQPELLRLYVPMLRDLWVPLGFWFGLPFVVVAVLVLAGASHAVNLTDGMDGLASGLVAIAALAFAGITYVVGHHGFAEYLFVPHVPGSGEMAVLCCAVVGACMGFLWFNAPPAQVFMGDTGSLPLGGALGYAALVSRTELVLLVVGGVFVAEAVSVMVQVLHYRRTGKRLLLCAPLHHHFQFQGLPEPRIVVRFWITGALLALLSLLLFKLR
jgi:phospho-N-acetylmuramoyl-pentapeptide-transferase